MHVNVAILASKNLTKTVITSMASHLQTAARGQQRFVPFLWTLLETFSSINQALANMLNVPKQKNMHFSFSFGSRSTLKIVFQTETTAGYMPYFKSVFIR